MSTRCLISLTSPDGKSPSANGPKEMRISRLTVRPRVRRAASPRGSCLREARASARHCSLARDRSSPPPARTARRRWSMPLPACRGRPGRPAVRPHAVAPQPAGARQLQMPRKLAVVGEQQKPFGIEIEPPHRDHAGKLGRQCLEHGLPALRVLVAGHEPLRLMVAPQPRRLGLGSDLPSTETSSPGLTT